MPFHALDLALDAQRALVPLVRRVQKHDRKLAQQLRDATNSFLLNLGEGAHSDPGTRRARYQNAAGSASEVRVGLQAAVGWGYLSAQEATGASALLERLLAVLWKLVR